MLLLTYLYTIQVLAQLIREFLCLVVSKGFFFEHLVWAIFARSIFCVLLAMSGTQASLNILALAPSGSFRSFLFKEFKSRFETDLLDPQ